MRFRSVEGPRRAGRDAVRAAIEAGDLAVLEVARAG